MLGQFRQELEALELENAQLEARLKHFDGQEAEYRAARAEGDRLANLKREWDSFNRHGR
jgi:cell division septum initiation protein DivIVA